MNRLKLIGMVCSAFMAIVMAVSTTGCGNDSSPSKSSSKSTKSSSSQSESQKSQDSNSSENESSEDNGGSADSESSEEGTMSAEEWSEYQKSDEHAEYFDEQKAGENALAGAADQIGEGDWRIVSTEKSTSPDGIDCWKVGVVNYADAQSPTYYFYCDYGFCILEQ